MAFNSDTMPKVKDGIWEGTFTSVVAEFRLNSTKRKKRDTSNDPDPCSCKEGKSLIQYKTGSHFHCDKCQFVTRNAFSVIRHLASIHRIVAPGLESLKCGICGYIVVHLSEYAKHMHKHLHSKEPAMNNAFARHEIELCESEKTRDKSIMVNENGNLQTENSIVSLKENCIRKEMDSDSRRQERRDGMFAGEKCKSFSRPQVKKYTAALAISSKLTKKACQILQKRQHAEVQEKETTDQEMLVDVEENENNNEIQTDNLNDNPDQELMIDVEETENDSETQTDTSDANSDGLVENFIKKSTDGKYLCPVCDFGSNSVDSFKRHRINTHKLIPVRTEYFCRVCQHTMLSRHDYIQHKLLDTHIKKLKEFETQELAQQTNASNTQLETGARKGGILLHTSPRKHSVQSSLNAKNTWPKRRCPKDLNKNQHRKGSLFKKVLKSYSQSVTSSTKPCRLQGEESDRSESPVNKQLTPENHKENSPSRDLSLFNNVAEDLELSDSENEDDSDMQNVMEK